MNGLWLISLDTSKVNRLAEVADTNRPHEMDHEFSRVSLAVIGNVVFSYGVSIHLLRYHLVFCYISLLFTSLYSFGYLLGLLIL